MAFEKMIQNAFNESANDCRFGDTLEEIAEIQDYIRNAEKICVPNKNGIKVEVLNEVLNEYGLPQAEMLQIDTNTADTSRIPALVPLRIFKSVLTIITCFILSLVVGFDRVRKYS